MPCRATDRTGCRRGGLSLRVSVDEAAYSDATNGQGFMLSKPQAVKATSLYAPRGIPYCTCTAHRQPSPSAPRQAAPSSSPEAKGSDANGDEDEHRSDGRCADCWVCATRGAWMTRDVDDLVDWLATKDGQDRGYQVVRIN